LGGVKIRRAARRIILRVCSSKQVMLTKLGKYEIKREIGSGAMGLVYLAEDPKLGRPVALKTTSIEVASSPDLLKRFYREAQAAAQLCHPNIVTIYEIDEANGVPFIAMEYLEGVNLQQVVSERRELLIPKKLQIIIDACRGLDYAHQHGVVHRDIKPGNIMLANNGQVKIVDFGIARVGVSSMTRTGVVLGTVMYMSPEQVQAQTVDARSDLFSLGVVLYELLTYQSPFRGADVPSILFKILNEPPEPVTKYLRQCPPQLEQFVERALAKDREDRYQTAEDMAFDLQRLADSLKRSTVSAYLEQGQRSLQAGDLTVAKESLQKILEIDSSHEVAQTMLAQVRESIQSRQRTQKIEHNLRQAKEAFEAEQYEDAISLLDESLRLDPRHAEAQGQKQLAIKHRDRAEEIRRHIDLSEKLASEGDFARAKAELEGVLALDPANGAAHVMMNWIAKELTERERHRQVQQYLEGARLQLADQNPAKALELLESARELDTLNVEVEALLQAVRSSKEREERRQALVRRMTEIEEILSRGQLEEALTRVEQALREFPGDPQVLRLHMQVLRHAEVHKKRRYVDEQLQAAREFLQKNEYSSALAIVEKASQSIPDDPRLGSFLQTVQKAQEQSELEARRKDVLREANEHLRAGDYSAAIQALEKGMARVGQCAEFSELMQLALEHQSEQRQRENLQRALSRAHNYLREEQYEEAVQFLTRAQDDLNSSEIDALLKTAQEGRESFVRQREEIVASAVELLKSGHAAKAVARFEAAPKAHFKDENFQRVYSQCRKSLDRENFVRAAGEQINKYLAEEDTSSAESVLEQASKAYPDDVTLIALEKRVREEALRLQRDQRVKLLEEVRAAMGHMEYARATELLTTLDWESGNLPELAAQAKSLLEEAGRRSREVGVPQLTLRGRAKRARAMYKSIPVQTQAHRRRPFVLATVAALVLVLASIGGWYLHGRNVSGYVQLTAAPWGQITAVTNAKGQRLNITGQTPLRVPLPPGRYNVELKNGQAVGNVEVTVERGKVSVYNYTFREVTVEDLVQKLLSEY
jgi:eukaryotic-like serine/threonine-protein kinase